VQSGVVASEAFSWKLASFVIYWFRASC